MTHQIRQKIKTVQFICLLLSFAFMVTSCSTKELTSESYRFGKETGTKWRDLTSEIEALSSWAGEGSGESLEIPKVEKESACNAMWLIFGLPKFGLKDMAENRENFVEGCSTTIGS